MNKKLVATLAALAAVTAMAVAPMQASAAKWTVNGIPATEEHTNVVGWGTLTLTTVVGGSGSITCHNAAAGFVLNKAGIGEGATQVFATYDCESTACPFTPFAKAYEETEPKPKEVITSTSLPWPSKLEVEGTTIRSKTTGVKVFIGCAKGSEILANTPFVGGNQPSVHKGTSAGHPGFVEFDAGSGLLEAEGSGGTVEGKTEGEAKTLGYEEQELINAKNP